MYFIFLAILHGDNLSSCIHIMIRAVTSAGSSELIAVSSLCTYDIYRTYINPDASGKKILKVSRAVVLGFGCFMGLLAVILNKAGVSLGWMYLAMGILIGSAVLPIAFMLLWRKANAIGAILGTIIGCVLGVITWLVVTKVEYGRINLDTTGRNAPMLAGNLVSVLTGGAIHAVCSFLWPQDYDWDTTKQITMVEKEKNELPAEEFKEEKLIKAKAWIIKWGVGFTVVIVILWPLLTLPAGNFILFDISDIVTCLNKKRSEFLERKKLPNVFVHLSFDLGGNIGLYLPVVILQVSLV